MLAKTLEEVDSKLPIEVVDIDIHPEIAAEFGIRSVPTIDVLSLGRPTGRVSSYPGGTAPSLFIPVLPLPYNEAKSCGVPYDLPVLAGSLPSFLGIFHRSLTGYLRQLMLIH